MHSVHGTSMQWLSTPSLPTKPVALCAVSAQAKWLNSVFAQRGIQVISVPSHPGLPKPCSGHPDMLLCHVGGVVSVVGEKATAEKLSALGMQVESPQNRFAPRYPKDVLLNVLIINRFLLGNLSHVDPAVLYWAKEKGLSLVPVAQGYARCSSLIADTNSIITADPSITKEARRVGIEVLEITPGYVVLPGYSYGFIGGCCGLVAPNLLAICGKLDSHPDYLRIRAFLQQRGVTVWELPSPDGRLWDIGGIIPLAERYC